MSFLLKKIKKVRSRFEPLTNLKPALELFKNEITELIASLHENDNLRIFDQTNGGTIRGPRKIGDKSESKHKQGQRIIRSELKSNHTSYLSCQEKYLADEKLEVPYFMAVFNLPKRTFMASESTVRLVGHESPLMRKKSKFKNQEISTRAISCDLIGITSDRKVVCIEGKVNPEHSNTDIVYGILESYAYGICMEYYFSKSNCRHLLQQEINACFYDFHAETFLGDLGDYTAAYSLAAPKEYFHEFFAPQILTPKKAKKRRHEAQCLIDILSESNGPEWAGFFVLDPSCEKKSFDLKNRQITEKGALIEPHFNYGTVRALVAKNIDELMQISRPSGVSL